VPMTRQKILITGASSGLGAGMARAFAAKGRDLALCARRTDRLDELKAELLERHPGITVAVAALDVTDHEQVPKVFAELSDELGRIDRIVVNAGIGKGAPLGSGKLWANKATIETNLVAALEKLKESGIWIFGAAADKGVAPWSADLKGPACLVLGGEGEGLRPLVARTCDLLVTVPMRGGVGSLNVAAAGAALCYEVARQRGSGGKVLDLSKSQA